jgi:hypothetical protein
MLANCRFQIIEDLKNLRANTGKNMSELRNTSDVIEEIRASRKKRLRELMDTISEFNPEAILLEPRSRYDYAIHGYSTNGRAIYSIIEILGILINEDGMTEEEAQEFFDFNIEGAYMGEYTPIYMYEE